MALPTRQLPMPSPPTADAADALRWINDYWPRMANWIDQAALTMEQQGKTIAALEARVKTLEGK